MLFAPKSNNGFGLLEFIILLGFLGLLVIGIITVLPMLGLGSHTVTTISNALP